MIDVTQEKLVESFPIIRGYFKIYQIEKKTCKEYPTGFTYILKKEKKDNVISREDI